MYKSQTNHIVDLATYLDKIFEQLPSNAFINKGRCGIGGTTLELNNKNRCSIIVAPTVGILKDKIKSHPDLFIVFADVSYEQVWDQLARKESAQKIMTTPEGIKKIIKAATKLKLIDEIYANWFLMLDECHTYVSEDFRKDILRPFKYFWKFSNKAILSATPYFFSDEKFATLDYHEIKFTETLGAITLLNCKSVWGTLNHILKESEKESTNIHVYLNSVTEIKSAAELANLTDFNIFCADDRDGENMRKLGDMQAHFKEQPDKHNFKKINFYTSRYYEGWDLFDENAVIILVTDVYKPHTKVSVGMKLKQAVGRLRNSATQVLHLTNHHNNYHKPKKLEAFKKEYTLEAELLLRQHAEYIQLCKQQERPVKIDRRIEAFADIKCKTHEATLNSIKLDQQINQAYSNEIYNNIQLIEQEWKKAYYDVTTVNCNHYLENKTTMKRKSKATQLKEDYEALIMFKETKESGEIQFHFGRSPEEKIKQSNPLAYEAARLLDKTMMEALSYNVKKVKMEVISASNQRQEAKLFIMLHQSFKQGQRLSIDTIRKKLQEIYNRLNLRNVKTGEILKAEAAQLENNKWFDIHPCKVEEKGENKHGFIIQRASFAVKVAA